MDEELQNTSTRPRKLSKSSVRSKIQQLSVRPSLRSPQSTTSLQRAPSAPYPRSHYPRSRDTHQRTQSTAQGSSTSSINYDSSTGPSPIVPSSEFGAGSSTSFARNHHPAYYSTNSSDRSADDLIGAPFDANTILSKVNSAGPLSPTRGQFIPQRAAPPLLTHTHTAPNPGAFHRLRLSQSFTNQQKGAMEITPPRSESGGLTPNVKRLSDETSGPFKPPNLRKKSGFSSFVNSMLGSPRTIKISAPENPVHMIHVGYDQMTGQFSVSQLFTIRISLCPESALQAIHHMCPQEHR